MSNPSVRRFFAPKQALIALGIALAGVACSALVVDAYMSGHRIKLGVVLLAAVLLVMAPGYLVSCAFPKGCAACKRTFASSLAVFPTSWQDAVETFLARPSPELWESLCQAPSSSLHERVKLTLEHCEGCQRIGQAQVEVEYAENGEWMTKSCSEKCQLDAHGVQTLVRMVERRNAPALG